MAKTAEKMEGRFTKTELQQKHEVHLRRVKASSELFLQKVDAAKNAVDKARTKFAKHPTRKNYEVYQVTLRRAFNLNIK